MCVNFAELVKALIEGNARKDDLVSALNLMMVNVMARYDYCTALQRQGVQDSGVPSWRIMALVEEIKHGFNDLTDDEVTRFASSSSVIMTCGHYISWPQQRRADQEMGLA